MNIFTTLFAICCLAVVAKATPGYSHGSDRLEGIPDLESFSHIKYPKYDILGLGEYSKGHLPADEIHVTKHVTIKEPEPYPVKVPVPHPYPVPVPKPYPVVETKYVKVPHAVPYEIVKKVPIPVEVPKPYPVPVQSGGGDSWHAGSGNVGQVESYGVQEQGNDVGNLGGGGHISSYEAQGYDGADQGGQQDWQQGGQGDWQPSGQQEEGH